MFKFFSGFEKPSDEKKVNRGKEGLDHGYPKSPEFIASESLNPEEALIKAEEEAEKGDDEGLDAEFLMDGAGEDSQDKVEIDASLLKVPSEPADPLDVLQDSMEKASVGKVDGGSTGGSHGYRGREPKWKNKRAA